MDEHGTKTKPADGDAVLMGRIRDRDATALARLYELRGQLVYSLALSIVRNIADAEEVTQEVFYKVWQKADTFDSSRGSGLAWLVTMTRRQSIDRTRSRTYKARHREIDVDEALRDRAYDVGRDGDAAVEAREVIEALNRLDGPHRQVIQLSYYEGLSHAKIADHLGAPLGTIKGRIREAMIQLRRILDVKAPS